MTIKEYSEKEKEIIDLSGPCGNVFYLISQAIYLSKKLNKDSKKIINEMKSGDYGNAVCVFDREFGEFFDIILPENMSLKEVKSSNVRASLNEEKMSEIYLK